MKRARLEVTDHAVLRYLETVYGVDVDALRQRIAKAADLAAEFPDLPESRVNSGRAKFVVHYGSVVAVRRRCDSPKTARRK